MGFDNFRLNVVLRVLALLGNGFVLLWGYLNTDWQVTPVVSAVLILLQSVELVHYVERSNRQLTSFLHSVTERDFSTRFSAGGRGESFQSMAAAYNLIMDELAQLNSDKEAQHQLLAALVDHISVALLCLDDRQRVTLMNDAAKRLFDCPYIQNTRALGRVNSELPDLVTRAPDGESHLLLLNIGGERLALSMFTTRFELLDRRFTLVSFHNIRDELEMQEIESWQQLIRVLTHEIMNSLTPIVSLTSVIQGVLLADEAHFRPEPLDTEQRQDLLRSLNVIAQRGKGLMQFVQSYKNLANPPKPVFTDIKLCRLLDRLALLMQPELDKEGIELELHCQPEDLNLHADVQQVEQILINLLRNAREALDQRDDGRITIRATRSTNAAVTVSVEDNGPGIAAEHLQDIFVPFYTSKKDGTGVGLSISKQLMQANRGVISCNSTPGKSTQFTLVFRNQLA